MAKIAFYAQVDPDDCGVAALRMVLAYYGRQASAVQVRQACGVQWGEISLLALSQGARHYGLEPLPMRLAFDELSTRISAPFIAHIQGQHYVVVTSLTTRYVWIADPARGRYKLRKEEFMALWLDGGQGVVMGFEPGTATKPDGVPQGGVAPDYWRPRLPKALQLALIPELVALWLLLQGIGAMTEPRAAGGGLLAEAIVSLLLLVALLLLMYRRTYHTRQLAAWQAQHWASRPLPTWPAAEELDRLQRLFYLPWRERRFRVRLGAWPQGMLSAGVLAWYTWQVPRLAVVLAVIAAGAMLWVWLHRLRFCGRYYVESEKQGRTLLSLLQKQHSLHLLPHRMRPEDEPVPADWFVGSLALHPGRVWLAVAASWLAAVLAFGYAYPISAGGMLALLTAAAFGLKALYGVLGALRARSLALYDVRQEEAPTEEVPDLGEATLAYQPPAGLYPFTEIALTPGTATLILGPRRSGKTGLLQRLAARQLDDGGRLLLNTLPVSKTQRLLLLEDIALLGQSPGACSPYLSDRTPADAHSLEALRRQLFPEYRFSDPASDEGWQDQIDALLHILHQDPDLLLLDEPFRGMDPFRELILLEHLLQLRKGRTTVISSQREELTPLVDRVFILDTWPTAAVEPKSCIRKFIKE